MAESALIFTTLLTLWSFVKINKYPWLIALPAALAFSAKQSLGVLALVGILAVLWMSYQKQRSPNKAMRNLVAYSVLFLAVTFLLNPFLWSNPLQAAMAAVQSRQSLLQQQIATVASVDPEKSLTSIPSHFVSLIAQLYFTPPAIADVANYLQQTNPSTDVYLSNQLNHLFRDLFGGAILLFLTLSGLAYSILQIVKSKKISRYMGLFIIAGFAQFLALGLAVSLPYQRYSLPMIPFICIWSAMGLNFILEIIVNMKNHPFLLHFRKG
jgi:hypothetical protein